MNNPLKIIAAATFLFAVAASPLSAQTNLDTGANNGADLIDGARAAIHPPASGPLTTDKTNSSAAPVPVGGDNPADTHSDRGGLSVAKMALLIPLFSLLIPIASFVMITGVIAIIFHSIHRRNKLVHETLRVMVEKGAPVTPELIASLKSKGIKGVETPRQRSSRLLVGLILVGAGIGIWFLAGKPGLIPVFIGVAFLIVWFVERKNNHGEQSAKP